MNETRGNSRTKPMRGGLKGGEINSLKDSEKTNKNINICRTNICIFVNTKSKTGNFSITLQINEKNIDKFMSDISLVVNHYKI